jgi:serine/threonine-protein kinase
MGYILMEYVQGMNIVEYLEIHPEEINEVFFQVVAGFAHLEENDILHRDIRPANILVTDDGTVKIIDLGFESTR